MENLIGQKFGRLKVISLSHVVRYKINYGMRIMWNCLCDCGCENVVGSGDLKSGKTKSCGCLLRKGNHKIHNMARKDNVHPLYAVWTNMKQRCYNPNNKQYKDYGNKGIKLCNEWLDSMKFLRWGSDKWAKGLVIDRVDNNGNYSPANCRFVDRTVSARNTRLLISNNTSGYRGVSLTINGKWKAAMKKDGKTMHLGFFDSPRIAALRYDVEAYLYDQNKPRNLME